MTNLPPEPVTTTFVLIDYENVQPDAGFDPLMNHLQRKGVLARRFASLGEMQTPEATSSATEKAHLDTAIGHLVKMKAAKPRTRKTLASTLHALFRKELTERQLTSLIAALCAAGFLRLDGDKVSYGANKGP